MKIIFTLIAFSLFGYKAKPVSSTSFANQGIGTMRSTCDKKKAIHIGSSRGSGEMQLGFSTDIEGEATITILSETGKIVLEQTSRVRNGTNTIPIKDAIGLAEGTYTIRLIANNEIYVTRFLIWK